ncbi:glycosyl hydrolase family 18 protein [Anaerosacchariphilus polymeriproducens]|uniref:glycosyl hydrolase family 18 protein n=1 Tax=Anaerosacchariphilus polymeriproducens TaxID=1812858 RepID=UPI001F2D4088|nr:glycosyl hydrolase family 18 protein [Anaerosacchariphilus polymeriproducens]
MKKKKRANRPIKQSVKPILAGVLFVFIVLLIALLSNIIKKYTPTSEHIKLAKYFNIETEDQVGLVIQDEIIEKKAKLIDGVVYLEYNLVRDNLNERFYWDSNENKLLYALPQDLISVDVGSKDYYVGKKKNTKNYAIIKVEGDTAYIAVDFIKEYTDMDYNFFKEPNHVMIVNEWNEVLETSLKKDSEIRLLGGIKSPIVEDLKKGETVTLLEKGKTWSKVRTKSGFLGYIKNNKLNQAKEVKVNREFKQPEYTNIKKDYTINMVWHQITNADANGTLLEAIAKTKGVNTISPTWFALSDEEGNISSLASQSYVNYAHQLGIEVWALVSNFEVEVDTNKVLSYTSKREKLINQLIAEAIEYNLDGINVDFEELSKETGDAFLQFIRELSIKCRNNDIVLSIDNYVPMSHTAFYNRKEQGIVADYVVIMGYDEHYEGSEEGSVASKSFVETGIINTLKEVPAEKVILGIPFYTRIWKETPKTKEEIAKEDPNTDYVPYNLTSVPAGMETVEKMLKGYNVTPVWDEKLGQYYAQILEKNEGCTYKIWLEAGKSIEEKLKLMKTHKLAGVAEWKLGLEKSEIWDIILKYVN